MLASTSDNFAILRFIMMVVLGFLLITNPPRKMYFRVLVGLLAAGLTSWGIWATYQNQIGLVDGLSLLQFGISAGITVLERDYQRSRKDEAVGKLAVYHTHFVT